MDESIKPLPVSGETPRTNEEHLLDGSGMMFEPTVVLASFARQLERDLIVALDANRRANEAIGDIANECATTQQRLIAFLDSPEGQNFTASQQRDTANRLVDELTTELATERAARESLEKSIALAHETTHGASGLCCALRLQECARAEAAELRIKAYLEAVTPEAAWAVVKARELSEDLDSSDYFDAGYKAAEARAGDVTKLREALHTHQDNVAASNLMTLKQIAQELREFAKNWHDWECISAVDKRNLQDLSDAIEGHITAPANPPQVDATLESIASELRTVDLRIVARFQKVTGVSYQDEQSLLRILIDELSKLADALSAHAHKSQPVNERLLLTCQNLRDSKWEHRCSDKVGGCVAVSQLCFEQFTKAIRAAESAAPGENLERELAEALRQCVKAVNEHKGHGTPTVDRALWYGAHNIADAALKKFDARKTEGGN